jgi:1-acyl-sn-glycerol-3-phosphate acyltransferase
VSSAPASTARAEPLRVLTQPTLTYHVVRTVMRLWFFLYFRRRIEGREHLPREGGVLIAANHQSYLDIPLLSVATSRHISFVARRSLARSRILAFVMRECGAVLVDPGKPDRAALREIVAHLDAGDCIAIFPEGTRSPDGRLQAFRAGALLTARLAGVPIVPVAIRGTADAWNRRTPLPLPRKVALRFAPPIPSDRDDALELARAAIAERAGDGSYASVAPE